MATGNLGPFQAAHVASAPSAVTDANLPLGEKAWVSVSATVESGCIDEAPSTNFQLAFWRDAKKKYHAINPATGALPEDYVLIVGSLVLSLTFLFGRNYSLSDWSPSLLKQADALKSGKSELYDRFKELVDYFVSNLRHVNSERVENALLPLTYAKVREWMRTTQEVWLWFFDWFYVNQGNGSVPEDQFVEFREIF